MTNQKAGFDIDYSLTYLKIARIALGKISPFTLRYSLIKTLLLERRSNDTLKIILVR